MRRRRRTATPAAPCCSMSLGSPLWASSPCSWCCRLPGVVGDCSVGENWRVQRWEKLNCARCDISSRVLVFSSSIGIKSPLDHAQEMFRVLPVLAKWKRGHVNPS
jgi:hypothetical protein